MLEFVPMSNEFSFKSVSPHSAFEQSQRLDKALGDVSRDAFPELFQRAGITTAMSARTLAPKLGDDERERICAEALVIAHGKRVDREDLDTLAKGNGIAVAKTDTSHKIIARLIRKIGIVQSRALVDELLKPGALITEGTFSTFLMPTLPSNFDATDFSRIIEGHLEEHLHSGSGVRKKVKVRPEVSADQILMAVYFERSSTEGRAIRDNKSLVTKPFARGAADTFFIIRRMSDGRTTLLAKSPSSKLAKAFLGLVGQILWKDQDAISSKSMERYDLNALRGQVPGVCGQHRGKVDKVLFDNVSLESVQRSTINIKAWRGHDALQEAVVFDARGTTNDCPLTSAVAKFYALKQGPKKDEFKLVASVLIRPESIRLDEEDLPLVEDHLRAWGVIHA